jgi:hypothetical protein
MDVPHIHFKNGQGRSIMRRRRKRGMGGGLSGMILAWVFVLGLILVGYLYIPTPSQWQAERVVSKFYHLEQQGDFGGSWELFHSQMKKKFDKQTYIQKRAHVLMQDFGTQTFDFEIGRVHTEKDWKMASDAAQLTDVYWFPVYMTFHSTFGYFTLEQNVYVTKEKDEWRILWSYSG